MLLRSLLMIASSENSTTLVRWRKATSVGRRSMHSGTKYPKEGGMVSRLQSWIARAYS